MNQLLLEYNRAYWPAAPVLEIAVDGYTSLPPQRLTALVDTGADGTILPITILNTVGAQYESTARMRGVTGSPQWVDRYKVRIQIGEMAVHGVAVVAGPANGEAILGRDVLNHLKFILDGPAHMLEIHW
jgi:predicted aspartyl protease